MKLLQKTAALFLAVLLCFSLLPAPAQAAETVSEIKLVNLVEPKVNEQPDYTHVEVATRGISLTGAGTYINWYCSDDGRDWESTKYDELPFLFGYYYKAVILVAPDEGYSFANKVSATVNGRKADCIVHYDYNYAEISTVFEPMKRTTISKVELTLPEAPAVGKAPNYTDVFTPTLSSGAYYVRPNMGLQKNVRWFRSADGSAYTEMDDGVFESGYTYKVCINVLADAASVFSENTQVTVNGGSGSVIRWGFMDGAESANDTYGDIVVIEYIFPTLAIGTLDHFSVTGIPEPAIGAKYETETYTLPEDAKYSLFGAETTLHWYYSADGENFYSMKEPFEDGYNFLPFRAGYYHKVLVEFMADPGYDIAENATATINGREAGFTRVITDASGAFLEAEYVFPPLMLGELKELIVTGIPEPKADTAYETETYTLPQDAKYSLFGAGTTLHWYYSRDGITYSPMKEPVENGYNILPFRLGYYHMVLVGFIVDFGYSLADTVSVKINGREAAVLNRSEFQGQSYLDAELVFEPLMLGTVDAIRINDISRPVVGSNPNYNYWTAPEGSGYDIDCAGVLLHFEYSDDGVSYTEMSHGETEEDGIFQKGRYYRVWTVVRPLDGYDFSDNVSVFFNGVEGKIESVKVTDGIPYATVSFDFGQLNNKARSAAIVGISVAGAASVATLLALAFSRRKKGQAAPLITK